jgi:hypothetical protein
MAKKHWIYIKRGLSEDPKHRAAMGECIWLYLHIIDRADWEKGIAYDWKDEAEAADMSMPVRTLREQRRKLDDLGYISCVQLRHNQNIIIKRWVNPRDYSGGVMNTDEVEGDIPMEPLKNDEYTKGDTKGYTKGSTQDVTPTSNSISKSSSGGGLSEKELSQANAKVDAMIANAKKMKYENRDKIPEPYHALCDAYVELTQQKPSKRVLMDWIATFSDWVSEGLQPQHIRAAYQHANRPDGGFLVGRPGSLTNTAVALKSKTAATPQIDAAAVEDTRRRIEEKTTGAFVPRPDNVAPPAIVKQRLQELSQQKGLRK